MPASAITLSDPASAGPLRIALLGYRSNPWSGGQGIYLRYLSRALVDAGHQVDVISGPPYPQLDARVSLVKLPSLDLYSAFPHHVRALRPAHLRSFTDTFEWASMATGGFPEPYTFGRRLARHFRQLRRQPGGIPYDIVHDNQSLCSGLLDLLQMGLPLVSTIHHPITSDRDLALAAADGWQARLLVQRWYRFLAMQQRVVQRLPHLVTVSECSRQDIAKAFDLPTEHLSVVHNGIDTDLFRPQPSVAPIPRRLMAIASADQPLKGLRHLLEAVALLRNDFPDISVTVIGKITGTSSNARLLRKLDLDSLVHFRQGLTPEEIRDAYAEAEVAVVPSLYEGFGLPAGEAMACGVPVVSTDGGALPEVVGDAGVIVPAGNSAALAAGIAELLQDPARRQHLARAGRERILDAFSWQVAAQDMVRLYRDMLSHQPLPGAATQAQQAQQAQQP